MIQSDWPKTRAEAEKARYAYDSIFRTSVPWDSAKCAAEVSYGDSRRTSYYQCPNKPGHGPDGLYCRAHAPLVSEASETWWYVGRYSDEIKRRMASGSTEHTVIVNGSRDKKVTDYGRYFPTWEEAHAYVIQRAEDALRSARAALERAESDLIRVRAMTPPDDASKREEG
jgi:hypothetical protein